MEFPPIQFYDSRQSVMALLKAIAEKEAAVAKYARGEAKKINLLLERMDNIEQVSATGADLDTLDERGQLQAVKHNCLKHLADIGFRQQVLQSSLQKILQCMNVEDLYQLYPLPQHAVCKLSAQGQGQVTAPEDTFFGGTASVQRLAIRARKGQREGTFQYRVTKGEYQQQLEAVSEGLHIDLVRPRVHMPQVGVARSAVISGYGVTARSAPEAGRVKRALAWFALTLWNYGYHKGAAFRIVIINDTAGLTHDSGIIQA